MINKMAAKSSVANAKSLAEFRRGVDFKLTPAGPSGVLPKVIPSDVVPSFAYGRKSRVSTPIAAVVGGQYAAEYEDCRRSALPEEMPCGKHRIKLTKAAADRMAGARSLRQPEEPREIFKLTKFKKVQSRLRL